MDTSFITINTHSSIRLQSKQGTVIYVDPYGFNTSPHDADLILVTHTHFDHFSPEDIAKVRTPHTAFVMPALNMREFIEAGFTNEDAAFLTPGEHAMPLPGIEIDGLRVYVAGDTDDLPQNRSIACDIALVPVGGTYTMNAREAAAFVNALRPAVAIPEHYGTVAGSPKDGKTFASLVDPQIEVVFKL